MKYHSYMSAAAGAGILACLVVSPAAAQEISAPEAREALLERTERLVPVPPDAIVERFADVVDPFYLPEAEETEGPATGEVTPRGPSEREILEALADRIQPSGIMVTGGEQVLLFGERRVRAGDVLQLSYQGETRRVVVDAVSQRSFTLRFGQEKISKPVQ